MNIYDRSCAKWHTERNWERYSVVLKLWFIASHLNATVNLFLRQKKQVKVESMNERLTSRLNKYQGSSCFSWNVQKALVDFLQRTLQTQKSTSTSVGRGEEKQVLWSDQNPPQWVLKAGQWVIGGNGPQRFVVFVFVARLYTTGV